MIYVCICRSAKKRVKPKKMKQLYRRKKTEDQDFHEKEVLTDLQMK